MNIFISWSGDRSHQVAKLLKRWIKSVVQASRPWISSDDIGSGTKWFAEITGQLESTAQGIICVTNANKNNPWILFEAGALSKGLTTSPRVYPLLIDLDTQDVVGPLAQFNHTWANRRASMYKLVLDINASLPVDNRMDTDVLNHVFETFWPEFETKLAGIIEDTKPTNPETQEREESDISLETLKIVRGLGKRMSAIEEQLPNRMQAEVSAVSTRATQPVPHGPFTHFIRFQIAKGFEDDVVLSLTKERFPRAQEQVILRRISEIKAASTSEN